MLTNDKDPNSPFFRCRNCGITTTNEEGICRQCDALTDIGTVIEHAKSEFYRQARRYRAKETDVDDEVACAFASLGEEMHQGLALVRGLLNERKETPPC